MQGETCFVLLLSMYQSRSLLKSNLASTTTVDLHYKSPLYKQCRGTSNDSYGPKSLCPMHSQLDISDHTI